MGCAGSACSSRWGRPAAARAAAASRRRWRSGGRLPPPDCRSSVSPDTRVASEARSTPPCSAGCGRSSASCGTPWRRSSRKGSSATPARPILSAGGSVFFDEVVAAFAAPLRGGTTPRTIIRPGAYVSHDAGHYERLSPFTPTRRHRRVHPPAGARGVGPARLGPRGRARDRHHRPPRRLVRPRDAHPAANAAAGHRGVAGRLGHDRDGPQRPARVRHGPRRASTPGSGTGSPSGSPTRARRSTSGTCCRSWTRTITSSTSCRTYF